MAEIFAYLDAILNLALGFMMIVIMGFLLYLLSLALSTMVRNKQPRWDAIAYVIAILVLGLAMWRYFPTIAIKTMRISLQEARPEAELLEEEVRRWIPSFEVSLPTPVTNTVTIINPMPLPTLTPAPAPSITITVTMTAIVVTPLLATATPYPTYTPWPTATHAPTATPCMVSIGGNWLACPPTPVIGGE